MWIWIALAAAAVVALIGILIVAQRKKKRKPYAGADAYRSLLGGAPESPAAPLDPALEPLRQNLRVKLLYQEEKVDAAIALERERNPSGNLEQWMKAAIAGWERDNR